MNRMQDEQEDELELVDYNEDEDTNLDTKDANEGKEVKK